MKTRRHMLGFMFTCLMFLPSVALGADEHSPETTKPVKTDLTEKVEAAELKPTELGIRFTPAMARAMSMQVTKGMKPRYELSDDQAADVEGIFQRGLMKLAQENQETGRDLIEMMMETMIANDGRFPKEVAIEFSKKMKPLIPVLKEFFTETAGEIGKKMTIKQRLKLTGDMTGLTAGMAVFENRMKRWEEGKVGNNANPFFDPADEDPSLAESEPEDPNEHPDHRRARRNVERSLEWQINPNRNWKSYVDQAIEYYKLDEAQSAAARAILKECQDRAKTIKTPDWRKKLKENRIAKQMAWRIGGNYSQGPWMYQMDNAFEHLMKPLKDLGEELKRRIEGLPTTSQRSAARETARKAFGEKGVQLQPV
ncbi:MAG: hypothetical protein ACE5EQ_02135 [Phycisphaerae bacterium]